MMSLNRMIVLGVLIVAIIALIGALMLSFGGKPIPEPLISLVSIIIGGTLNQLGQPGGSHAKPNSTSISVESTEDSK